MTAEDFRDLALSLPDAVEGAHMGHPDFRVGGRIFATLSAQKDGRGMVKLPLEEQATLCAAEPAMFTPVPGGWGRSGCTHVVLEKADERNALLGLRLAWQAVRDRATASPKTPRKPRRRSA